MLKNPLFPIYETVFKGAVNPEIISEADKSAYYNSVEYVTFHISEITHKINEARSNANLGPIREMKKLHDAANEMFFGIMNGKTDLDLTAEIEKSGLRTYGFYYVCWVFIIYEIDTSEKIIEICGDTLFIENLNSIGIGYVYNEERGCNYYYIIFAVLQPYS